MKKNLFAVIVILISYQLFGQGSNWEQIPLPFKSQLDIIAQNSKGVLLGKSSVYLGAVVSYDDGISWSYAPLDKSYTYRKYYGEDFYGNFIFDGYDYILRLNPNTFKVDSFPTKDIGSIKQAYGMQEDFIVVKYNNGRIASFSKNGSKNDLISFAQKSFLLGTSISPTCYIISENGTKNYLYKVNEEGKTEYKNAWPTQNAKYFLHGETIIRDIEYTTDEGKNWAAFNLPFTKPDSIFNYNGNIAFAKDDKIYSNQPNSNNFTVIDLPMNHTYKNAFIGKTILSSFYANGEIENSILRQASNTFVNLDFDIATPYATDFAAGANDDLVITGFDQKVHTKKGGNNPWVYTGFKSINNVSWVGIEPSYSFNRDNILSLHDSNEKEIYSTADLGISWKKAAKIDSLPYFYISERKIGSLWLGDSTMRLRKPSTTDWQVLKKYKDYHNLGDVSNQLVTYSSLWGAEILLTQDTIGNRGFVVDLPSYDYNFDLHYEMNYVYNFSAWYRFLNNKPLLSRSFDNGFTFEPVHINEVNSNYTIKLLWTGHILQIYEKTINISDDYGFTWQQIPLELSDKDYIRQVGLSPDNFLYVLTAEKGLLKLSIALPMANIIRFNVKEDLLGDCELGNDTTALENIKVRLEGQATQLTDKDGNAVFYTFRKDNTIIIEDDANVLDICKNNIPVQFAEDHGLEKNVNVNVATVRTCPNLSMKFVVYADSLRGYINYSLVVTNNGNETSSTTKIKIELDPFQYFYQLDTFHFEKIDELNYLYKLPSLKAGQSYSNIIGLYVRPDVPFDHQICISAQIEEYANQCKPNPKTILCNPVNRQNKNKTIKVQFYNDLNGNCLQDADEPYIYEHFCVENNKRDFQIIYDSIRYIQTAYDTNSIKIIYDSDLYELCQDTYKIKIPYDSLIYVINVPVKDIKYCSKLNASLGWERTTRCFDSKLTFYVRNDGNKASEKIHAVVTLDNFFEVYKITPQPTQIDGNKYYFDLDPIDKREYQEIDFECKISCNAPLSFTHCSSIKLIEAEPSCHLGNELSDFCFINGGSYDPNDKSIVVSGEENKKVITKDDKVEYRIRFQNTGTDTAYTVRIEDVLSRAFDISSMRLVHTTHACTWKIQNRTLIVDFKDIDLVDSFRNEPASHGEILFEIKLIEGLKVGDKISNKAKIFFDYNLPVITNESISYFALPNFIVDPSIGIIEEVSFLPNPAISSVKIMGLDAHKKHMVSIYTSTGKSVTTASLDAGKVEIEISNLISGAYLVVLWDGVKYKYGKLIKI